MTPLLSTIEAKFERIELSLSEVHSQKEVNVQEVRSLKALYDELCKKIDYLEQHGLNMEKYDNEINNLKLAFHQETTSLKELLTSEVAGVQELNTKHFEAMVQDVNNLDNKIEQVAQVCEKGVLNASRLEQEIAIIKETEDFIQ